jgi:cytochrome c-type biogenesis protein CcmH/NrfG
MTAAAIEIFKLNVAEYPNYANGYDSLGEAYLAAGDKKQAVVNYAKSLEHDPTNANAAAKLAEILNR